MDSELIYIYILTVHMAMIAPQYAPVPSQYQYYQNMPQQYMQYQQPQEIDDSESYDMEPEHYSDYRRRNSGGKLPTYHSYDYADQNVCKCSCNRCKEPKPCCRELCMSCPESSQSSLVFVPYPYPVIVPGASSSPSSSSISTESTTPRPTTSPIPSPSTHSTRTTDRDDVSTASTAVTFPDDPTSATKQPRVERSEQRRQNLYQSGISDGMRPDRYVKQLHPVKMTKPPWVPKYGLVPIPDHLALKLMSQLKEIQGLRANRGVDDIYNRRLRANRKFDDI